MNSTHANPIQEILQLNHTISTRIKLAVPNGELPSQLEKDLLKDDLRRLYTLVEQLSVFSVHGDADESLVKSGRKNAESDLSVIVSQLMTQQVKPEPEGISAADATQQTAPTSVPSAHSSDTQNAASQESGASAATHSSAEDTVAEAIQMVAEKTIAPRLHEIRTVEMYEAQKTIAGNYTANETLGDKITKAHSTTSIGDRLQHQPLKDLKQSIGINERFAFINELFSGDQQQFFAAVDHLNNLVDFQAAEKYIAEVLAPRFQWELHNERSEELVELVKRRFSA